MIKAEIVRKGDMKVKLEIEITVDELKDLGNLCSKNGFNGSVMQQISIAASLISDDVERIFRSRTNEQS